MIRATVTALLLTAAVGLSGCASLQETHPAGAESISGRLSVRVEPNGAAPAKTVSGSFDLLGSPSAGRLNLASPLGTVLAQARWSPQQVLLSTPQGETAYPDLETLAQQMLGESLPIAALFDWLRGRPWSGAPSQNNTPSADPGFSQLGWTINLARFDEGWVIAQREQAPQVTVRARVDRP